MQNIARRQAERLAERRRNSHQSVGFLTTPQEYQRSPLALGSAWSTAPTQTAMPIGGSSPGPFCPPNMSIHPPGTAPNASAMSSRMPTAAMYPLNTAAAVPATYATHYGNTLPRVPLFRPGRHFYLANPDGSHQIMPAFGQAYPNYGPGYGPENQFAHLRNSSIAFSHSVGYNPAFEAAARLESATQASPGQNYATPVARPNAVDPFFEKDEHNMINPDDTAYMNNTFNKFHAVMVSPTTRAREVSARTDLPLHSEILARRPSVTVPPRSPTPPIPSPIPQFPRVRPVASTEAPVSQAMNEQPVASSEASSTRKHLHPVSRSFRLTLM